MKIIVVCGNGLGTSLMMEMSIKSIVKELNVEATVDHVDLGSAKGTDCDIFVGTNDIAEQLNTLGVEPRIVALKYGRQSGDERALVRSTSRAWCFIRRGYGIL